MVPYGFFVYFCALNLLYNEKKKYRHAIIIICKIVDVICKTEIRKLMLMNKFILISLRTNREDLT